MTGLLEGLQHQRKLDGRNVLHFVDDDEVVTWRGQPLPLPGDEVQVVEPALEKPGAIFLEQVVELVALIFGKDGLAHAQRPIVVSRQNAAGTGGNHPADLLEDLVTVELLESLPQPREPAGKVAPACFPPLRYADGFDELAIGKEYGLLPAVFITVGIVEIPGALGEVGGVGDVEHLAFHMLELFQGQRGLAAAGAAYYDQGRRQAVNSLLRVVEGNRLVEQVYRGALRVQVAHRLRLLDGVSRIDVGNPGFIDSRATQEAGLVVIVIGDHFQHQCADFVTVADQGKQQPVGVIELRPVEPAVAEIGELLDLCGAEVAAGDGVDHPAIAGPDTGGVEVGVFEDLHRKRLRASDGRSG